MAQEKEPFGMIDRFTSSVMDQVSRRGFLKGAGAIGLALLGTFFGIGSQMAEASANVHLPLLVIVAAIILHATTMHKGLLSNASVRVATVCRQR